MRPVGKEGVNSGHGALRLGSLDCAGVYTNLSFPKTTHAQYSRKFNATGTTQQTNTPCGGWARVRPQGVVLQMRTKPARAGRYFR
jgi:hypothetical protein